MTQGYMCSGKSEVEYKKHEVAIRQTWLSQFLQAMREDLSEWISSLAFHVSVTSDTFLESLDNGIILCQHARLIQRYAEEYAVLNKDQKFKVPSKDVYYTEKNAFPGSFIARDNVANFIAWCRDLGIPDVVIFESEDLVLHKNEKTVILTLLDVARKAYKFGVQPPEIVRFEKEIDDEIERDKEDERLGKPIQRPRDLEEDNDLDTMVRNVVDKCTCFNRFPIKKLDEGKYKVGRNDTLIFVRIMRKHVMVRVGGGWDTLDHYITKHDPCRTKVAGSIDNTGHHISPFQSSASASPRKPKHSTKRQSLKSDLYSTTSSDTWSMCSGSSESSGSLDVNTKSDCYCGDKSKNKERHRNSVLSNSSSSTGENTDIAISFTKSIEELDNKLKLLEDNKPTLGTTLKDTSLYVNKADRWLRNHMNSLKQRRMSVEESEVTEHPLDKFVMRRGYTSDNIERKTEKKQELLPQAEGDGKPSRIARPPPRSKTVPNHLSNSLDQGLNNNHNFKGLAYNRNLPENKQVKRRGHTNSLSISNQSLNSPISEPTRSSCSDISTQTDFILDCEAARTAGMPRALRNRIDSTSKQSRIPRPSLQRSNTLDGTSSSKLRKRNTGSNDQPGLNREKSDLFVRPVARREKSDVTGRHSKYKQPVRGYGSPSTRRATINRNEKPVRIRNGVVLDLQ